MKILYSILVLVAVTFIVGYLMFMHSNGFLAPLASDEELIERFTKDREQFEVLVSMFAEETSQLQINEDWRKQERSISKDRWLEYQSLFETLNLKWGVWNWNDGGQEMRGGRVWFLMSGTSNYFSGSTKYLVYRPEQIEPLFESLDGELPGLEPKQRAYRKIDDDWYLAYTYKP